MAARQHGAKHVVSRATIVAALSTGRRASASHDSQSSSRGAPGQGLDSSPSQREPIGGEPSSSSLPGSGLPPRSPPQKSSTVVDIGQDGAADGGPARPRSRWAELGPAKRRRASWRSREASQSAASEGPKIDTAPPQGRPYVPPRRRRRASQMEVPSHTPLPEASDADRMSTWGTWPVLRGAAPAPCIQTTAPVRRLVGLLGWNSAVCICKGDAVVSILTAHDLFLMLATGSAAAPKAPSAWGAGAGPKRAPRRLSLVGAAILGDKRAARFGGALVREDSGAGASIGGGMSTRSLGWPKTRPTTPPGARHEARTREVGESASSQSAAVLTEKRFRDPVVPGSTTCAMRAIMAKGENPLLVAQAQVAADLGDDDDDGLGDDEGCCSATVANCAAKRRMIAPPLRQGLRSLPFQIVLAALLTTALVVVLADADRKPDSYSLPWWIAFTLMWLFLAELGLRTLALARACIEPWSVIDAIAVAVSLVLLLTPPSLTVTSIVVFGRGLRLMQVMNGLLEKTRAKELAEGIGKRLVSQNKRRFMSRAFDLDLTYITDRIVAMSLPSMNVEGLYRNPIEKVAEFLDLRHPQSYVVVNLCAERNYPGTFFHNRVIRVPFEDHGPPQLAQLVDFASAASDWLAASPTNVLAIHCKGGKGRTGTVVASLLLETGEAQSPTEALEWFAEQRTAGKQSNQGVSGASQRRYVGYYSLCRLVPVPETCVLYVDFVRVWTVPRGDGRNLDEATVSPTVSLQCPSVGLRFSSAGLPLLLTAGLGTKAAVEAAIGTVGRVASAAPGTPRQSSRAGTAPPSPLVAPSSASDAAAATSSKRQRRPSVWGRVAHRHSGDWMQDAEHAQHASQPEDKVTEPSTPRRGHAVARHTLARTSESSEKTTFEAGIDEWFDVDCWGLPVAADFRLSIGCAERSGDLASACLHSGAISAIAALQARQSRLATAQLAARSEAAALDDTSPRGFGFAATSASVTGTPLGRPVLSGQTGSQAGHSSPAWAPSDDSSSQLAGQAGDGNELMDPLVLSDLQVAAGHLVKCRHDAAKPSSTERLDHGSSLSNAGGNPKRAHRCSDGVVESVTLPNEAIDQACNDKANKDFAPDFRVQVFFTRREPALLRQAHLRLLVRARGQGSVLASSNVPSDEQVESRLATRRDAVMAAEHAKRSTAL